jgi:acetate kinase
VHGGTSFTAPTVIDADVEAAIAALVPLAPLHNPVALAGIAAARACWPTLPMAAVFDTAFHADRSPASRHYALPMEITRRYALYRYGFHGIAHASLAAGVAALEGSELRDVVAVTLQLGQGCSACAIDGGRSIETSMGFTPLEGLVMGTRSGDLDPGLVLHLIKSGMTVEEVEATLTQRSGLLGVGGSRDMRVLLEAESRGDAAAALALTLFVRRVVAVVGAYFTLLGGRGALVFGGGIGENASEIRRRVGEGLRAWNVVIDPACNASGKPGSIATAESRRVYVVPTDEESLIAAETARLIRS